MMMEKKGEDTHGLGNTHLRCMRWFHWQEGKNRATHPVILIALFSILFIFINGNAVVLGEDVKYLEKEKTYISQEQETLINPLAFCITDDELFIIPDYGAGNIKLYEKNGNFLQLINTIGGKGYKADEFSKPAFCFYNNTENKFGVIDYGIRKIFIYDRIDRIYFKRIKEISCWRPGYDIKLGGKKLFISGYISDSNETPYDFYYIDIENDQRTFLLPSYTKYGLNSFHEYEKKYRGNLDIPAIGVKGWFDINKDDAYFIWEGDLKVIKLNVISGEINPKSFGMKPPHYIKPYASENLLSYRGPKYLDLTRVERTKMSYVRNIFISSKYLLVIYEGPFKQDNGANFRLQFYTFDGDFIKEVPIPGAPDHKMWFDKGGNILYSLCGSNASGVRKDYFILKYQIVE